MVLVLQETRLNLEHLLEIKGTDVENKIQVNYTVLHVVDRRHTIDGCDTFLQSDEFFRSHQVRLIGQDTVSKGKLCDCFVLDSLRLGVVQMCQQKLAIHNCDDAVEIIVSTNVIIDEETNQKMIRSIII